MDFKKCTTGTCGGQIRVVFDTNFLMIPHENKIDVFLEIQKVLGTVDFLIPEPVVNELKLLSEKNTGAKVALGIMERKLFEVVSSKCSADDAVLDIAKERGAYVATMDAKLRQRVRDSELPLITLRNKKYIVVE